MTVGRGAEVARLREAWDDAVAGAPGLVLIRGEAGIGKSRLVDELAQYVRETSGSVLIGGCFPLLDGVAPYAPIREALEPLVDLDLAEGPDEPPLLSSRSRLLLRRTLFPDDESVAAHEAGSADFGQGRMFAAVRTALLEATAQRPVMLVIEDLHWADLSTLQVLTTVERGLRRSTGEHRLLIVLTSRTALDGRHDDLSSFLHEFRRSPLSDVIDLAPLDAAAAGEMFTLLSGGSGTPDRAAALVRRADGNPFLLEELAAAGDDEIPAGAREMLELRLRRLPREVPGVLRAAAVLGTDIDPDVLAGLVGPGDVQRAIPSAVRGEVLLPFGDRYVFRHALFQELLYSQLLASDRRQLHALAATTLAARGSSGTDGAQIAYHFVQAGDSAQALVWSVRAAAEAERLGAMPEAIAHYVRALDLLDEVTGTGSSVPQGVPERAELTYRAGLLSASIGQHARGAEMLARAAALYAEAGERTRQADALVQRGYALVFVDIDAALAACDEALALLEDCPTTEENALLLGYTGAALLYAYRAAEAMPRLTRAARMAADVGSEYAIASVDVAYGVALSAAGQVEEGVRRLSAAFEVLRRAGDARLLLCALGLQIVLVRGDALEEAMAVGIDALDTVAAWGGSEHWWGTWVRELVASCAYDLGEWDVAATHGNLAMELTRRGSDALPFAAIAVHLGRGELDEAHPLLDVAHAHMRLGNGFAVRHLAQVAELACLEGRYDDALDAFRDGMRAAIGTEAESVCGGLLLVGAMAAADQAAAEPTRQGTQRRQVSKLETELLELAAAATTGPCGSAPQALAGWNVAVRAQWLAELSRLRGNSDPHLWQEAVDKWRQWQRPYREAYCLMRAADAAAARRMPRSAVLEPLRDAVRIARELQAVPLLEQLAGLAERTRIELPAQRSGASPTPDQYGLTGREREVLALLAAGMTNAELASNLFISTHTANVHVSRILMKLGVPNRTRAASLAWAQGLAGQA